MSNLSEQELIRREKLKKIRELGINPYPADLFKISINSKQIKADFKDGKQVGSPKRWNKDGSIKE